MKKTALALMICFLTPVGQIYAACKSDACRQAVAWKNGYTAIVLDDDITPNDYLAVLSAVKTNKGVVAIEAERVFLGWVPAVATGKIRAVRGVRTVLHDVAARPDDLVRNPHALSALSFFNRVVSGEYEDAIEAGLATKAPPLTGCIVERADRSGDVGPQDAPASPDLRDAPASADTHTTHSIDFHAEVGENSTAYDTGSPARPSGGVSSNFWYRTPFQNPDMRGRVAVQVFRLDSDGTGDPNLYTWTSADLYHARDQVYGAFNFWVSQATARNITLSFKISIMDPFSRYTRNFVPTNTRYEPIRRPSTQDYLWVNDALAGYGYGASPLSAENVYTRNEAFNRSKLTDVYGGTYDRSFSVYIVYNPGTAPERFTDGRGAYAMFDGPFTMNLWNSNGWGPENLGRVVTHETGHIFWACDEYESGCFDCDACFFSVGPRNRESTPWIRNANCENANAIGACDSPRTSCMMQHNDYALCPHTPGQVGW